MGLDYNIKKCLKYVNMTIATTIAVIAISPVSSFSQETKYLSQSNQNYECSRLDNEYKERREYWGGRLIALKAELNLNEDKFTRDKIRNVKMAFGYFANSIISRAEKHNCDTKEFDASLEKFVGN